MDKIKIWRDVVVHLDYNPFKNKIPVHNRTGMKNYISCLTTYQNGPKYPHSL